MKKSCKVLCLMLVAFMISGCMKMNVDMSINKDKSMKLSITSALANSLLDEYGKEDLIDEDEKKQAEEQGFKIEKYKDETMTGYTFTKEFKNIDDISSEKKVNFDLNKLTEDKSTQVFTVKKSFFKNTYTVVMENSTETDLKNQFDIEDDSYNYSNYPSDLDYSDTQNNSLDFSNEFDISSLMSSMDMKFNVTLPYKAISSNATTIENDGKTLKWDLLNQNLKNLEFEFELYNMNNIYLTAGVIVVIILLIIIILKKSKSSNKNNATSNDMITKTSNNSSIITN